ncbi:hypothetical protein PCAR4_1350006 [Paraburkholderia caribensis]|nr:hypothetical protein PCAR4_1350006 [Paraburkholderia caribensis]
MSSDPKLNEFRIYGNLELKPRPNFQPAWRQRRGVIRRIELV